MITSAGITAALAAKNFGQIVVQQRREGGWDVRATGHLGTQFELAVYLNPEIRVVVYQRVYTKDQFDAFAADAASLALANAAILTL